MLRDPKCAAGAVRAAADATVHLQLRDRRSTSRMSISRILDRSSRRAFGRDCVQRHRRQPQLPQDRAARQPARAARRDRQPEGDRRAGDRRGFRPQRHRGASRARVGRGARRPALQRRADRHRLSRPDVAKALGADLDPRAGSRHRRAERGRPTGTIPSLDYIWFTLPSLVAIITSVAGLAITSQSWRASASLGRSTS